MWCGRTSSVSEPHAPDSQFTEVDSGDSGMQRVAVVELRWHDASNSHCCIIRQTVTNMAQSTYVVVEFSANLTDTLVKWKAMIQHNSREDPNTMATLGTSIHDMSLRQQRSRQLWRFSSRQNYTRWRKIGQSFYPSLSVKARHDYGASGIRWHRIANVNVTIEIKSLVSRRPKDFHFEMASGGLKWQYIVNCHFF